MKHQFDDFVLDTERYQLLRDGEPCALEPRVFDLIAHLVRHPDQVFSRDDLVTAVWQGRYVADATISTCIKNARKALGDSGTTQRYIETVRGRGFRFRADVTSNAEPTAEPRPLATTAPQSAVDPAPEPVREPSLLVLPFRPLTEDTATCQLAGGIGDELLTVLMRIPLLRLAVLPPGATNADVAPAPRQFHEQYGAHFLLEGSVQTIDNQFHIHVGLTDAAAGFRLWSDRLVVPGPIGTALETGVIEMTARLEPQLHRAIHKLVGAAGDDADGRVLFLEASSMLALKGWHHDSFARAAELLRQSWQRAPEFALAPSFLALILGFGDRIGLMGDRAQARQEALTAAERALELDGMDSTVLGFAGCALADIGQLDRGLPMLRNAVEINPANGQAWAALGGACLAERQFAEGIAHLRHGIAISPLDSRLSIWGSLLSAGLLQHGDLDDALAQSQLACQRDDRNFLARVVLAGVRLARAESAEAGAALADAFRIKPDLTRVQISSLLGRELGRALLKLRASGIA